MTRSVANRRELNGYLVHIESGDAQWDRKTTASNSTDAVRAVLTEITAEMENEEWYIIVAEEILPHPGARLLHLMRYTKEENGNDQLIYACAVTVPPHMQTNMAGITEFIFSIDPV
jgi:hypothetical protein